jgi:signal transduction histidine kinase
MAGMKETSGDNEIGTLTAPPRLLLVDDLEDNRIPLARRLERGGYEVVQAEAGLEALERLAAEPFDLVLLDINMPGMDGFEVLTRIRERHSAAELPVIMVTVRDEPADVTEALRLGANDYLTKPIDLTAAEARIRGQVARARAEARARRSDPAREELLDALREALRQAQASARAKSDFLANMSHEIRTPLNGVLGLARALEETSGEERTRAMARTIVESAGALERLLSDALDLSRMEAGKLEVRPEPFDLAALVRRAVELFEPAAAAKGLALSLDSELPPVAPVVGDALRLQQILTNLVSNAVKFTAEGEVTVRVRRDGRVVAFQVSDTGIGFDPARAAELFARFEQADGSIARRFGGSGLGLAISRSLAELMGGELTATAAPGEGSVFTLKLPLPEAAAATPTAPAREAPGERLKILAADDHATNRQVLELMLAPTGAELVLVSDGAQALEALATTAFDLVLMDVQMPVLDGLSAIRMIRQREGQLGLRRTPILALSAHASPEHERMSLQAGADDHVTKPLRAEALFRAIEAALSGAEAGEACRMGQT